MKGQFGDGRMQREELLVELLDISAGGTCYTLETAGECDLRCLLGGDSY